MAALQHRVISAEISRDILQDFYNSRQDFDILNGAYAAPLMRSLYETLYFLTLAKLIIRHYR